MTESAPAVRARTLAVTSGKGGVGKSNIALNLGVALGGLGAKVCLVDANLGLGNLDLLCGLNGYWNLSHVVSGARRIEEILLTGPNDVRLVPGASGLVDSADCPLSAQRDLVEQLESLELSHDFLIIDTGAGIHRSIREFLAAAETVLVVTTPEPTALADAYATIKSLSSLPGTELEILVNQAETAEQAAAILEGVQKTARAFLHRTVTAAGSIPRDAAVPQAVRARVPFVVHSPASPAATAVQRLARRLRHHASPSPACESFFPRVWSRLSGKAA
ncbi:MAG: P-loop NTPase [Planctomycetaceae bacterium]|nr:P-loop NTPase [Planctomycetaceae bacterium]